MNIIEHKLITFVLVCRGVIEARLLASLTAEHAEQIRSDLVTAAILGRMTLGTSLHEELLALLNVSGWNFRHFERKEVESIEQKRKLNKLEDDFRKSKKFLH